MPPRTKLTFLDEPDFQKIISGIDKLYKATAMTLGPRSRSVLMDYGYMLKINKDGVSVAKSIYLEDPVENAALAIVREAAQKTVDSVGDGTSVTIILAHALIHECLKVINSGTSPMALRKGLEEGVELLTNELDKIATPIKTLEEKINIATISASGDSELGKLIATTLEEIGEEGIITVEESKDLETKVEKQEGMQLENGYSHPLFINNPERMAAIYENVPILVSTKNIIGLSEFGPFLQNVIAPKSKQLVIIAPEVSMDVMEVLIKNKLDGNFFTLVIKAPGVGENQKDILRDIGALTGAKVVSAEAGDKFDELIFENLGVASRIIANKQSTVITGNTKNKPAVDTRIAMIKQQMHDHDLSDFEIEKLRERLGKLTNGIAVLQVGGATQVEMQERKERAIDAVAATQAAIKEGIVPGGEISLLRRGQYIDDPIFKAVLVAPFKTLVANAGYDPGEILAKLMTPHYIRDEEGNLEVDILFNSGFDVTDGEIKDMVKAGIIDPVAVPKAALRNAVSVAIQIVTLGAVITPIVEEKN